MHIHVFQAGMMRVCDGILYVSDLIWSDDVLLGVAKTFKDYLQVLKQSFERMRKFNVQLNPNKTDLCSREITLCERKISETGIRFDDSRIKALPQLPEPTTADQLQKFVCAANRVRKIIPRYAEAVFFLQELLKSS